MRKGLLSIGVLSVFLITMLMPVSQAFYVYNPPSPSYPPTFYVVKTNDAGYVYNLSRVTYLSANINITGTFKYNNSLGGYQAVAYYIGLGQAGSSVDYYIQPGITLLMYPDAYGQIVWVLEWFVQAWGNDNGYAYDDYNVSGIIAGNYGSSVSLNCVFTLTIQVSLNSQGQITCAYVTIKNAQTGYTYFSKYITSFKYPILDNQAFFEVEDPLGVYNGGVYILPFPIIPSNNYVFTNACAINPEGKWFGLPFTSGIEDIMKYPHAWAYVTPTFGIGGSQGVQYIW